MENALLFLGGKIMTGKRVSALLFALGCLSGLAVAQGTNSLQPGRAVEREIAGGQSHTYPIKLAAGQFLRVVVEQKGVDVALALVGPDGRQLIESDLTDTLGAREPLSFESPTAGNYQIVIRANGAAMLSGSYQVRLELKDAATAQDRKRIAAEQLLNEAAAMTRRRDFQQGIEKQQQALTILRELGDRDWEAVTLRSIGGNHGGLSRFDKAVEYYEQVLVIRRALKDRQREAYSLFDLGLAYERLSRFDSSLDYFAQALAINQELKNRREEGVSLGWIGWVNHRLGRFEKAIEYNERALVIAREVKNRDDEGAASTGLGAAYIGLKQFDKAIEYHAQYLAISRELKSRSGEGSALNNLALAYRGLLRFEKSIEYLEQTLAIYRELKDRQTEALALRNLGDTYSVITRLDKAVESYEQALPIYREIKDRQGEAFVLGPLANIYDQLGRPEKAIEYFELALPINREFKNRFRIAGNLMGLGNANLTLGKYEKSIEFYEQALVVARENKLRSQEGIALSNLGESYQQLNRNEKAIEYLQQALVVSRELKDRRNETYALDSLGNAFRAQAQYRQATQHHERALGIAREIRYRLREGEALHDLMLDWQAQNKPAIAVFYGKQAVNLYQEIRSEITGLARETQQSFVKDKEETYRELADLLISAGRLPEAEQVIRMLKEEEYFDFVRRDQGNSPKAIKAALTPEEQALEKRYHEIADQIAVLGAERGTLIDNKTRTPEQEQRLAKLDADLVVAGNAFQKFLSTLESEMSASSEAGAKVYAMRESQGLMEDLRELGKGTVALYTLVGEDKYRVILTTPDFQKGYEYPIKAADLNRKVLEFRDVLQNPKLDPLPLARELYKILLGPVAKDLQGAKAQVLMWSLDGVLRYLPMAALNDGRQYLVEQYQEVVFTPASQARLKDTPSRQWNALGLGVTKAHGERIPALPGVAEEMHGIIREAGSEAGVGAQAGVLPGTIKLDEAFTQESMLAGLRLRPSVVHVASHFQFSPGNETNSALLLGDGSFLSLAQIKSLPNVFGGVELLTLSACNTATGGSGANGKEVEGFGVLAQRQGAKAVVASLWPVADRSTKELMQELYRLREAKAGMSKAEALRQAQLTLLRGGKSNVAEPPQNNRQIVHDEEKLPAAGPLFKLDPGRPYAHPYYWAPFILIGNWK
jgi:CHAT domain-containing protein/lipopolysaccharide biosynthesis regulator YciM